MLNNLQINETTDQQRKRQCHRTGGKSDPEAEPVKFGILGIEVLWGVPVAQSIFPLNGPVGVVFRWPVLRQKQHKGEWEPEDCSHQRSGKIG